MSLALLVDDEQQLMASIAGSARAAKLDLVCAASWDEGLALFHVLSPQLVIADYNMPGSRMGLQLLVEIRRLRPSVRLVLVSGYLDTEDMAKIAALDLVDETYTKGSSVETAQAIIGEIQKASELATSPTDWVEFARAYVHAARVSDEEIEQLDEVLAVKLPGDDAVVTRTVAVTELGGPPSNGYFDTSALMRWVERDVQAPDERNTRGAVAVDELLASDKPLAVSELTLVEFRAGVAEDWRRSDKQKAEYDAEWALRAKTAVMKLIADGRVGVVSAPAHAFEHAMTLVDMAARDHGRKLGTWDAIHLITACRWAYSEGVRVRLYTTNGHFEHFTAAYPHFERFAEIVHLDSMEESQ